jgi:hypothetical protein
LFRDRWGRGISDDDGIEWVEVMDDAEETSIPFYNTKPPGAVSGVGRFIRTRHYFVTNNFDEFIVETWPDRDILVDPWHMDEVKKIQKGLKGK